MSDVKEEIIEVDQESDESVEKQNYSEGSSDEESDDEGEYSHVLDLCDVKLEVSSDQIDLGDDNDVPLPSKGPLLLCSMCSSPFKSEAELFHHKTVMHNSTTIELIQPRSKSGSKNAHTRPQKRKKPTKRYWPSETPSVSNFQYPRAGSASAKQSNIDKLVNELRSKKTICSETATTYYVHCLNCKYDLTETEYFANHFQECMQNPKYLCPFCGKLKHFLQEDIYDHFIKHFYNAKSQCKFCETIFINSYNEKCHTYLIHKNESLVDIPLINAMKGKTARAVRTVTEEPVNKYKRQRITLKESLPILPPKTATKAKVAPTATVAAVVDDDDDDSSGSESPVETEATNLIDNIKKEVVDCKETDSMQKVHIYCTKCKGNFIALDYLDHVSNCFSLGVSKCVFCSLVVEIIDIKEYLEHLKIHLMHHFKLLKCSRCNACFINHYNFKNHSLNFHGTVVDTA